MFSFQCVFHLVDFLLLLLFSLSPTAPPSCMYTYDVCHYPNPLHLIDKESEYLYERSTLFLRVLQRSEKLLTERQCLLRDSKQHLTCIVEQWRVGACIFRFFVLSNPLPLQIFKTRKNAASTDTNESLSISSSFTLLNPISFLTPLNFRFHIKLD